MTLQQVLRLKEAAEYVRVSEKTLREMAKCARVPCQRVGREWRFLRKGLDEWLIGQARPAQTGIVAESIGQMYLPAVELPKDPEDNVSEWGTFKDSLRAPIHNWFTYPAGFSYKAVISSLSKHGIATGQVVYDPFMGSGTTNLTAKKLGVNSYGVEAHPFVFRIARAKLNWSIKRADVTDALRLITGRMAERTKRALGNTGKELASKFPALVLKCYEEKTLLHLMFIRDVIRDQGFPEGLSDFLTVGLTGLLRDISTAATGWPYVAPNKKKTTSCGKDALAEYQHIILKMIRDIEVTVHEARRESASTFHGLFNSDSRNTVGLIPDESADHVFTSPPYLNNFDYADRTRLELYFFGEARTWGDISKDVRSKLITSATTQIARDDPKYVLSSDIADTCPEVCDFLATSVGRLRELRLTKGGKKSYDHLVSGYFNDMYRVVSDVFRVLKQGRKAVFVLGDSAPYGVHIPTDELIGKIGVAIGFSGYSIDVLRNRGDKWKANPMRHSVKLRESIVTLTKE